MCVQTFPWTVTIFKGEGRMLIIPTVRHIGGFSVDAEWFINIKEEDKNKVGHSILQAIEYIRNSPISKVPGKEREENAAWRKNSKYKSWIAFWRNNYCIDFNIYENGEYRINLTEKMQEHKGIYNGSLKMIFLPKTATPEEIGKTVLDIFKVAEEHYGEKSTNDEYPLKNIELLAGLQLSITPPKDKYFQDDGDSSAAEIYQCYSYHTTEEGESSAEISLGMAPELDCNLNTDNIESAWEDIYGKADHFEVQEVNCGIFILRAEMKNKEIHKISYFLQQEEDLLLECSMEVHNPNRRKKLDEKMMQMFEEFASGCKL